MSRGTMLVAGLVVLVLAGVVLLTPASPRHSPEHRSDSDAPDGASALYSLAEQLGHPVARLTTSAPPGSASALLFVFSPTVDFTDAEAAATKSWLESGGTLVYADEAGSPPLDARLGLTRRRTFDSLSLRDRRTAGPFLRGVSTVEASTCCVFGRLSPEQVPVLQSDFGVIAAARTFGPGLAVSLADPLELCNQLIGSYDNNRMAADLVGLVPPGAPVFFDEFHHGVGRASASFMDWATTPWGAAVAWALVIVYVGFLLRGRPFGPRIPIGATRDRSSAEFATAVGALLRRAGALALTRDLLLQATRRSIAERSGLSVAPGEDRFDEVLRERAPDLAESLHQAAIPTPGGDSEDTLLESARRLHGLAYPSPREK